MRRFALIFSNLTISIKRPVITGSKSHSGGKGLQVSGPTSCAKQGQLWHQTRLLRAFSRQVLKLSEDGACISSLATCSTAWLYSGWECCSLYPAWTCLVSTCVHCFLPFHHRTGPPIIVRLKTCLGVHYNTTCL